MASELKRRCTQSINDDDADDDAVDKPMHYVHNTFVYLFYFAVEGWQQCGGLIESGDDGFYLICFVIEELNWILLN